MSGTFLKVWCKCVSHSVVSDSATPWTIAYQASLSMEFSRQEYWSGLPCPLQGDLPNPGIKPRSLALQADSLPSEPPGKPVLNVLNDCFLKVLFWNNVRFTRKLLEQYRKCLHPPPSSHHDNIRDHTRKLTQGSTTSYAPDLASMLSQGQSTSL